jgi:hypothetical protein
MGKGLDTCLVVQPMTIQSADPMEVDIAERKKKLMLLTPVEPVLTAQGSLVRQVCQRTSISEGSELCFLK